MCAMDRSQIVVGSQMELFKHLYHLVNISSCPCLIRDSSGNVIYSNQILTSQVLSGCNNVDIMSALTFADQVILGEEDLHVVTYGGARIIDGVLVGHYMFSVLIEGYSFGDDAYTKWTFSNVKELEPKSIDELVSFRDHFMKIIISLGKGNIKKRNVFLLHSYGFTHEQIASLVGVSEKTSRNYSQEIRKILNISSQDELICFQLRTSLYQRFVSEISHMLELP
ncbi:hypothetical protein [Klebsiella michiganensis]|uniref:hypothetical protein n=1 Tax=Klebsiella michiganensis TaxID=1134687 RepID=UPI00259A7D17|nr:hypothetical protein [Klebsiella michiganensis]MDM4471411.1 hypothetical protein [Klebsiella michiganensis]